MKLKPRGKAFAKGNTVGSARWYKKGESGNPSGRPCCKEINRAARAKLAETVPGHPNGRTYAELFVDVLTAQGLDGNIGAISLLADRAEGRPGVSLSIDERDPIGELIKGMERMSRAAGPPEGTVLPENIEVIDDEREEEETPQIGPGNA